MKDTELMANGMTLGEYKSWLYDPKNIGNCSECPENKGFSSWQDRLPCGQWHCEVSVHCNRL